jgi:hypothetical protein
MRSLCRRIARLEECARVADEDCLVLVVTCAGMPVDPEDVRRNVEANSQPGQRCMLVDFTRAVVTRDRLQHGERAALNSYR